MSKDPDLDVLQTGHRLRMILVGAACGLLLGVLAYFVASAMTDDGNTEYYHARGAGQFIGWIIGIAAGAGWVGGMFLYRRIARRRSTRESGGVARARLVPPRTRGRGDAS